MPWRAKCEIMVKRGEARSFGEAAAMLGRRRRTVSTVRPVFKDRRMPYTDD